MIKRMNKVTSLLIAAAAVVSLIPATGVNAADRLETKQGTIDQAIAFQGGNYIYDGYKSDDSENGLYYNDGQKDKLLDDIAATSIDKYSNKYAKVMDGSDEYLVDLSNGTVIEDTSDDKMDSVKSKLKTVLSKTDRYGKIDSTSDITLTPVSDKQFGETWYAYTAVGTTGTFKGYVNEAGSYIDTDVTANINAYSSLKDKFVNVNKFNEEDSDTALKISIVNQPKVIAEDKDNLYTLVNVDITDNNKSSISVASKASAEIDFSKATIGNTQQILPADAGHPESYVINTNASVFNTTGQAVTVNGVTHTFSASYNGADLYNDLTNTSIDGFVKTQTTDTVTFTATTNENKTTNAVVASTTVAAPGLVGTTEGLSDTYTAQPAKITIAGTVYTYDATAALATQYSSESDLKNKVIAQFVAGTATYDFNPTTFTFTAKAATVISAADVKTALGDVKNVVAGTNAGTVATGKVTNASYIQKISKAQGTQEDGAYLPKSVSSYEVSEAFDSGDADDAVATINADNTTFEVINGVIYATTKEANKVTVTTIKLMKDKVKLNTGDTKYDVYLAEQDVQESQDIAGVNAVSVDVDGNTWALNSGRIYKFDGTDFKEVYTCDTGFDTLEVYNADSLITWEDGKDIYSTVNKKATETPVETPATTTGWVNTATGWTFFKADGTQVKGQWVNDGGVWYMIKADGIMATGWYNDNGTWYFLAGSGAMKTGWVNDNGTWYYLAGSGAMKTGWVNDNGTWYYLNTSGAMLANTTVDGYKLNASGAWVK